MKYILFLPLLLTGTSHAQLLTKNDLLIGGLQIVSGAAVGVRDEVNYHAPALFTQFPNLSRSFWDIRQSWNNHKWAPFKDANHTMQTVSQTMDLGSVAVAVFEGQKNWKRALKKTGFAYLCRKAGFHLTYSLLFKNKVSWH